MNKTRHTFSVIAPVYNGGAPFRRSLESVLRLDPAPKEIIIVADNDPASAEWASSHGSTRVKVIRNSRQMGDSASRNMGAKAATGDILFFVDADVEVRPGTLRQLDEIFSGASDVLAVMGSYDSDPLETNFFSLYKNLLNHYVHQTSKEEASTFWNALGAIRRRTFEQMNGFAETHFPVGISDIEIGYRMSESGGRLLLAKNLYGKHLKKWTLISLVRADLKVRAIPWTQMILSHHGRMIDDLNIGKQSRYSVYLVYCVAILAVTSLWKVIALIPAAVCLATVLFLNRDLFAFFRKQRGVTFATKAILWHCIYYFYCGIGYVAGLTTHLMGRNPFSRTNNTTTTSVESDTQIKKKTSAL